MNKILLFTSFSLGLMRQTLSMKKFLLKVVKIRYTRVRHML